MMESIIRDHIVSYMTTNKLFADEQHGFVPKRDCMSNLLIAMEEWTAAIEIGKDIDVIYTDFAKAFDSVPHKRLLIKLKSIGVVDKVLQWIKAFLNGRKHRVCVEGKFSDWVHVKSGIPQGSVLGPTLFVIFINDLPNTVNNCCKLFADDAKLYRATTTGDNEASLQGDINNLLEWSTVWQLPFNIKKCKSMHIGKDKTPHLYHMNEYTLDNVNEEKDLGVMIDSKLKFHTHTSSAIKKANSILGLIKRSFTAIDEKTLPILYTSMVRPHLEYGNIIWGPHFKGDTIAIEKVQRRATKLVPNLKHRPYKSRLEALNLPSLAYRRKRGDMITCYKIMTDKVNINKDIFFTLNQNNTRGHIFKFRKTQRATKQARCHSFSIRTINDWNSLQGKVVQAQTTNTFKNLLDKQWEDRRFESPT